MRKLDPSRQKLLRLQRQLEQESTNPLPLQRSALPPRSARSSSNNCRQQLSAGSKSEVSERSTPRLRASSEGPVPRSPRHLAAIADAHAMRDADGFGTSTSSSNNATMPAEQVLSSEDFAVFLGGDGALRRLEGAGGSADEAPVFLACNGDGATVCSLTAGGKVRAHSALNPHEPPRIVPIRVAIARLALGSAHAVMIANDGRLFEARGQQPHRWAAKQLAAGRCFISVACGDAHSLAVALPLGKRSRPGNDHSATGDVFAWGEGRAGQLGLGRPLRNIAEPTPIRGIEPATSQIACGMNHSLVACFAPNGQDRNQSSELFPDALVSFGWSEHGRLGPEASGAQESRDALEEGSVRETPTQIALPDSSRLHLVAAGAQHSVIATTSGELFAFGSNEFGQLGMRDAGLWSSKLVRVTMPPQSSGKLVQLSCSSTSTLAITETGELYSWGAVSGNELLGRGKFGYWVEGAAVVGDLVGMLVRCGQKSAAEIVSSVARQHAEEKRKLLQDKAQAEAEAEERRRAQEEESQRKAEEAVRLAEEEARLRVTAESRRRHEEEERKRREEEEARMQAERNRIEQEAHESARRLEEQARRAKEAEFERQQIQEEIRIAEQALLKNAVDNASNDVEELVDEVDEEEELEQNDASEDAAEDAMIPRRSLGSFGNSIALSSQAPNDEDQLECDDVQEAIALEPDELEDDVQEVIANEGSGSDRESPRKEPAQCKPPLAPKALLLPPDFVGNHGDHSEQRAQRRRDLKSNGALFQPVLESRRIGDGRSLGARNKIQGKAFKIPLVAGNQEVSC